MTDLLALIRPHLPYVHMPSVALGIVLCLCGIATLVTWTSTNRH